MMTNEQMLNMVLAFEKEYPREFEEIERRIKAGDSGIELLHFIRNTIKLDTIAAAQYRKAFLAVVLGV